jgi:hypothetical protein
MKRYVSVLGFRLLRCIFCTPAGLFNSKNHGQPGTVIENQSGRKKQVLN